MQAAGFDAYLVGGGVRDLLVGLHPKDFDVATNATPEEVRKLFRNCILIGRRFRLAHVRFGRDIIEVATFRGEVQYCNVETGMIVRDNVYGTIEEDACRRDFTVNALYYHSKDCSITDYTGGMQDIKNKVIRMIGEPVPRYHEDPVRMLRALRLAAKLHFTLDTATEAPILNLVGLLQNVPPARLFDEIIKWFHSGNSLDAFKLLRQHGLFAVLFPQTEANLIKGANQEVYELLVHGFSNTDQRMLEQKPLNSAFLFAVLLWWPLQKKVQKYQNEGLKLFAALQSAMQKVLQKQTQHIVIPKRLTQVIKEMWVLQYRFAQRKQRRIAHILRHPRFKIAYDLLLLRNESGENVKELTVWWTRKIATPQFHL